MRKETALRASSAGAGRYPVSVKSPAGNASREIPLGSRPGACLRRCKVEETKAFKNLGTIDCEVGGDVRGEDESL